MKPKPAIAEGFFSTFRAKLLLAFVASALVGAFLLFAAGSYYVNILQKRNVKASIELAQAQARQLARDIVDLLRQEGQPSLAGEKVRQKLGPLTEIVLRQNRKIVWAGIIDPATGTYVIEQSSEHQQTFKTRRIGQESYHSQLPSAGSRQPLEVAVNVRPATQTHEVHETIQHDGKPIGEIRLKIADFEPYARIETTSQQITYALATQATLLLIFFSVVFIVVWRLVHHQLALTQRNARLEQMAYVGTLASGLAHEIRNPLNAMNINLGLALEDLNEANGNVAHQTKELLECVQKEIHQLDRTLSSFLDFALPTRESVTRFSMRSLVEEVVESHAPQMAELGIKCEIESPPANQTTVEADRRLVYQALRNILLNAVQAVTSSVVRTIAIRIESRPEDITVTITDSGPGIPEEHLPNIFQAFYSTRKGGTGLGLAITKKIIEEHGGQLSASNVIPRGAAFRIVLPREARIGAVSQAWSGQVR